MLVGKYPGAKPIEVRYPAAGRCLRDSRGPLSRCAGRAGYLEQLCENFKAEYQARAGTAALSEN